MYCQSLAVVLGPNVILVGVGDRGIVVDAGSRTAVGYAIF